MPRLPVLGEVYLRLTPSQRAGLVAASASVPLSLVPLLKPRSATDQGIITGLGSAMNFSLTSTFHDAMLSTARGGLRLVGAPVGVQTTARATLAIEAIALTTAIGVQLFVPRREDEGLPRAALRTTAQRVAMAALSGAVPSVLDALPGPAGPDRPLGRVLRSIPTAVLAGAALAGVVQVVRDARAEAAGGDLGHSRNAPTGRSLGVGAVTALGTVVLATGERALARTAAASLRRVTGSTGDGSGLSHAVSLATLGAAVYVVGSRVYRRIESSVSAPDPALTEPPESPEVSGGPGSRVVWESLGREPRRHLATRTPAARIEAVMGEPAREPIRLYVGLSSASTPGERVALGLAEIERTGALDRSLLVLATPTGTGYLNYAAASTWEHLTRGDCASLTLQYSVRPSPLSLDRVDLGRDQNWAMWLAVAEALGRRAPADRPRVVAFGESLGAQASQMVFQRSGTRGLRALFVERGLWLGTPYISRWPHEVMDPERGDVLSGEVLRLRRAEDIATLDAEAAASARYVLLSHDDDGVALFSPELLVRSPRWLEDGRTPAVPPQARWSTPITFLQAAIDTKNAMSMAPGGFVAAGHDYRAGIARAVRFAFGLSATDDQMARVEASLRDEEVARAALFG